MNMYNISKEIKISQSQTFKNLVSPSILIRAPLIRNGPQLVFGRTFWRAFMCFVGIKLSHSLLVQFELNYFLTPIMDDWNCIL